jgi:hypothetical protein
MLKINAMDVNASATFCDEVSSKATEATEECVPTNSSSRCEWKKTHKVQKMQEEDMVAYFWVQTLSF